MTNWILLVAVLICPLVMGTMMLLMWRGMRHGPQASPHAPPPATPVQAEPDASNAEGDLGSTEPRETTVGPRT